MTLDIENRFIGLLKCKICLVFLLHLPVLIGMATKCLVCRIF